MSNPPDFAPSDPAATIAAALASYKAATVTPQNPSGVTLAPADPRRLHLLSLLSLLIQQRVNINIAGRNNLLQFIGDEFIDDYAALWGLKRLPPLPSTCTQRFHCSDPSIGVAPFNGCRVTDGTNTWAIETADIPTPGVPYVDAKVTCLTPGTASNGVALGQIATLVDSLPNCASVENISTTIDGRDLETLEPFRARLRDAPESTSVAGPRLAYQALALAAGSGVADAVALGPLDGATMAGTVPNPGEVHVKIIQGTRDASGNLTSIIPEPDDYLLADVAASLSAEDVRPLNDYVFVEAPLWVNFNVSATYYIARSRIAQVTQIQAAVQAAHDAYLLGQQSKIGKDVDPGALIAAAINAGAKRLVVTEPAYAVVKRDQSALLVYDSFVYGGVEDD